MAILTSCCCWSSVRRGSFACAIYTIVYYSFMLCYLYESLYNADDMTEGNVESILVSQEEPTHHPAVASIVILTLGCSFAGTVTSLLLLVGLYKDVRWLLLPWIVNFLVTICLDLAYYCYSLRLISNDLNPGKAMWATIALFIIILNIYAVLCVISQFQQYNAGRGRAEDDWPDTPPAVRYTRQSSVNIRMDSTRRSVALIVDSGTTTVNGLSPSHTTTTMTTRSPSLNPKEGKVLAGDITVEKFADLVFTILIYEWEQLKSDMMEKEGMFYTLEGPSTLSIRIVQSPCLCKHIFCTQDTQASWREFIQLYREFLALKSEDYKNRNLKSECYLKLIDKLREIDPDATRSSVTKKTYSLRSNYRRKLKVMNSMKSGSGLDDIYTSSLWYFNDLAFLRVQIYRTMSEPFSDPQYTL